MLETLLPPRPAYEKPEGEMVEEVALSDYATPVGNAQDSDDDEDDARGQRIGCAQQ
jgi:hypothetical protein